MIKDAPKEIQADLSGAFYQDISTRPDKRVSNHYIQIMIKDHYKRVPQTKRVRINFKAGAMDSIDVRLSELKITNLSDYVRQLVRQDIGVNV